MSTAPDLSRPSGRWADPSFRLPPQNLEAERGVLGAILRDGSVLPEATAVLGGPEDFYRDTHQLLYGAMLELKARGKPVDPLLMAEHLTAMGIYDKVGGDDTLVDLMAGVPHSANARYHAQIVHEKASLRAAMQAAHDVLEMCYSQRYTAGQIGEAMEARVGRMARTIRGAAGATSRAQMTCLADVQPEAIEWLWPGRIPLGMVTLILGDPGLGKSFLTCALAAMVSTGARLPDAPDHAVPPGSVLMLSAEDGLAVTIRPRLDAAGADVRRVHALTSVKRPDGTLHPFNLAADLPRLEEELDRIGDVRLITIDPVSAYLGGADEHKNGEIRAMLGPLSAMASARRAALVLVTHLNKGSGGKAIYRATGSLAFVAAARVAWLVGRDPQDAGRRLMVRAKVNIAAEAPGIAFRLSDGAVRWESGAVDLDADALLAEAARPNGRDQGQRGPAPTKTRAAMDWLSERLAVGPAPHGETWKAAEAAGISKATFYDALERLRIDRFETDGRKWLRLLPEAAEGVADDEDGPAY